MKILLSSFALCITFIMQPIQAAALDGSCEQILNNAQKLYSDIFPGNPKTLFIGPWCFRSYDNDELGDIYAGIYRSKDGVFKYEGAYTLGGPFGNSPNYVGQTGSVIEFLNSQLYSNSQNGICDTIGLSDDITYRTEGDTTYVSTNGRCIELPANRNICDALPEIDEHHTPIETGRHVLSTTDVSSFELSGINTPGFDSIAQNIANQKTCIIHAPTEFTNHTVHTDICLDITKLMGDLSAIPGINPPITMRYKGTTNSTKVDDCFNTNAASISNIVTHELWFNENGTFVKFN